SPPESLCVPSCNQHFPGGEQFCRVPGPRVLEIGGRRPRAGGRIVDFRAGESDAVNGAAYDKNLSIEQQCRRVTVTCGIEAAGKAPRAAGRIIKFRARESNGVSAASDKNLSIEQQRRRMEVASGIEAACKLPLTWSR